MALKPAKRSAKSSWSRPIADLVGAVVDPTLARRGFGQSDVIFYWDEIVGERIASMSQPIGLNWPARNRSSAAAAALVVRVESGFALELQHLSGVVLERVNAHLGWRCVDRLVLKQGPIERRRQVRERPPRPTPEIMKEAEAATGAVSEVGLRDALTRLGACVLTRSRGGD